MGDLKRLFIHFFKLCSDFEEKSNFHKKSAVKKSNKPAGRPEILNNKQKKGVLSMFKTGHSVSSIAKYYSVSRTVIQRLILKSTDVIHSDDK